MKRFLKISLTTILIGLILMLAGFIIEPNAYKSPMYIDRGKINFPVRDMATGIRKLFNKDSLEMEKLLGKSYKEEKFKIKKDSIRKIDINFVASQVEILDTDDLDYDDIHLYYTNYSNEPLKSEIAISN